MKSLIYTALTTGTEVAAGSSVPLGSIIRRYGKCINASGNQILINRPGYYEVGISATCSAAAAGNIGLSLQADSVDVAGAEASETITTADTELRSMSIDSIVRVFCCRPTALTVVASGNPTVASMGVSVIEV